MGAGVTKRAAHTLSYLSSKRNPSTTPPLTSSSSCTAQALTDAALSLPLIPPAPAAPAIPVVPAGIMIIIHPRQQVAALGRVGANGREHAPLLIPGAHVAQEGTILRHQQLGRSTAGICGGGGPRGMEVAAVVCKFAVGRGFLLNNTLLRAAWMRAAACCEVCSKARPRKVWPAAHQLPASSAMHVMAQTVTTALVRVGDLLLVSSLCHPYGVLAAAPTPAPAASPSTPAAASASVHARDPLQSTAAAGRATSPLRSCTRGNQHLGHHTRWCDRVRVESAASAKHQPLS